MKQIREHIVIAYQWERPDKRKIRTAHVRALREAAAKQIRRQIADGYSSGRLSYNIRIGEKDPEAGVHYVGFWRMGELGMLLRKGWQPTWRDVDVE